MLIPPQLASYYAALVRRLSSLLSSLRIFSTIKNLPIIAAVRHWGCNASLTISLVQTLPSSRLRVVLTISINCISDQSFITSVIFVRIASSPAESNSSKKDRILMHIRGLICLSRGETLCKIGQIIVWVNKD